MSSDDVTISPDIFYIGFQKAASTFLRDYFAAHPQIYWDRKAYEYIQEPRGAKNTHVNKSEIASAGVYVTMNEALCKSLIIKDTDFWSRMAFKKIDWKDFESRLEINPHAIAERIKSAFPDVKVLMVIRNQVDWLRSNYIHFLGNLEPGKRKFEDFCETTEGIAILHAGAYDNTIEAYLNVFGADRVKVLVFERLKVDYKSFLREVCDFLEIEFLDTDNYIANKGKSETQALVIKNLPFLQKLPFTDSAKRKMKSMINAIPLSRDRIIPQSMRVIIKNFYAVNNWRTSKLIQCDLHRYGY